MGLGLEQAIVYRTMQLSTWQVFPFVDPQSYGPQPCILYHVIDTETLRLLSGESAGVLTSRVQFTCQSSLLSDIESVVETVRSGWEGFSGDVKGLCTFMACWMDGDPVDSEWRQTGGDDVIFISQFDCFMKYRQ